MCKNYFHLFLGVKKYSLAGGRRRELLFENHSVATTVSINRNNSTKGKTMHSRIALITFLDQGEVDPGFGIPGIGGHPGHALPGHGHADQGLPGHGHPDQGLPGHGHPGNRPPNVPPNVTWPPQMPNRPSNELPPELSGNRPTNPINLPEGSQLPTDAAFVAVYTVNKGWSSAVIKAPPTAGTPPTGASPK